MKTKIAVALLTTLPALAAGPAAAEQLRAQYSISLLGFKIGEASAVARLDPAAYKIDLRVHLTGVAAMVNKTQGAATSSGAIANGFVQSAGYANTTANSTETRTVRMGLAGGGVQAVEIVPPFLDNLNRVPVTAAHKSGVVDPLSALVMPVSGGQPLVGPAACNRTIPVYDGLVRFNVTLAYTGTREVQAKGYSGPVTVCAARYSPLAGYKTDSKSTQYMANNQNMEVWLAPVPGANIVAPFHVGIQTTTGRLSIDAKEFSLSN